MKIATIGFSGKKLENFIELLKTEKVTLLIDTRLNNTSQLSGFAKRDDLKFLLKQILNIDYVHILELAPTKEILSKFKSKKISWEEYSVEYLNLLKVRNIEKNIGEMITEDNVICFLCSEHKPDQCHRKLLVDYLQSHFEHMEVNHLY